MVGIYKICLNEECKKEFRDHSNNQHEKYCSVKCRSNDINRFWSKIKKTNYCWLWIGGLDSNGYGCFYKNSNKIYAHRLSYELHYGSIPDGLDILHKCDNPRCVNPGHLWAGTHLENMRDMYSKGRRKAARGSKNKQTKLTEEQVLEIRNCYKYRNGAILAKKYNVSISTIHLIVKGKHWKWLMPKVETLMLTE